MDSWEKGEGRVFVQSLALLRAKAGEASDACY